MQKIVSNVYSKLLTILAKSSILDAWMGRQCASAGGLKIVLKIQMEIFPQIFIGGVSFQKSPMVSVYFYVPEAWTLSFEKHLILETRIKLNEIASVR